VVDINIATLANVQFLIELIVATVVGTVLWLNIPPKTILKSLQEGAELLVVNGVVAFVGALIATSTGTDIYSIGGFLQIVGVVILGVGGLSIAKGVIKEQTPPSSPGPPAQ